MTNTAPYSAIDIPEAMDRIMQHVTSCPDSPKPRRRSPPHGSTSKPLSPTLATWPPR